MVIGTSAKQPTKLSVRFVDRKIVYAGKTLSHQSMLIELPVLIAIGPKPVARVVLPLVRKANCDSIAIECPELLDQAIVQFLLPLAGEESDNLVTAVDEFRSISPLGINRVGQRHPFWIPGVPTIFCQAHFLSR